jgi:hypothetical protein
MPYATVPAAVLAVADVVWSFETWCERTKNVMLPYHADATPSQTNLSEGELKAVQALAHRIHSIDSYGERIKAFKENNDNDKAGKAAWIKWFKRMHSSWRIQDDMEKLLDMYERHPRLMVDGAASVSGRR